ncbi:MAG: hypothetical protein U5K51_17055 [Flavobacteriaceae bacterium]|nr:hypothetical protein [Flavobacteriaceae bacterium]
MDKIITESNYRPEKRDEWTLDELQHNYTDLIRFKRSSNKVLNQNSGIMEISYPYFYSVIMTNKISSKLNTKKIDAFLSMVIDPLGRTFSKEELVKAYNYPKENEFDVDTDWW